MKKIIISFTIFIALSFTSAAQKIIDIYQDGIITGSLLSSDIDSVSITGTNTSSRYLNFWRAGNNCNRFIVNSVDSIKVFRCEDEPLVYLGIVGFNQEIYPKYMDILSNKTSDQYTSFINSLTSKEGTLLYYSVDKALIMLSQFKHSTNLTSVNLITFTDGLDQGSLMMSTGYNDENDYLSSLNNRIKSTRVCGLPITAYSIGLRGNDVTDYTQFKTNLNKLASSNDKSIEVTNISEVESNLKLIADNLISKSNKQNISLKIPGQGNGTRVCFTFDGLSPQNSNLCIEGTFNLSDRSLRDITYKGISSTGESIIYGVQNGIFVTFTFKGLQRTDGNGTIPTNNIRNYNKAKGSTTWQINSEFTSDNITETSISHSGTVIMLVLDCSKSLGTQFSKIKSYANNFINQVTDNTIDFSINAPTNVIAKIDSNKKGINVYWDAVKFAESYSVYRSQSNSSVFIKIAGNLTNTFWHDYSPLNGKNYYKISANGHGLTSDASSTTIVEY